MSIIIFIVMLLTTVFLITLSIMFSSGKNAADFFGADLYFVQNDEFELIKAPNLIVAQEIDPAELGAGDIVIFLTEDKYKSIGEIIEKGTEEMEDKIVLFFKVSDEAGENKVIFEDAIVAKAAKTNRTLGTLVNFAKSPAGVLAIAVIPCVSIILWELTKPLFRKTMDKRQVRPVNKQAETPTFVPLETDPKPEIPVQKPQKPQVAVQEPPKPEKPVNLTNPEVALKAYKQTLAQTLALDEAVSQPQLFIAPEKPPIQARVVDSSESAAKKKPLSSVKLAQAIAAVNANKKPESEVLPQKAAEKTERVNQALAAYSKYKEDNDD